jgi:hypothetical protein
MTDDPFVDADWEMSERLMNNVEVCCCDKCHADMTALFAIHRKYGHDSGYYDGYNKSLDEIEHLREALAAAYIELSGKDEHASDCATSNAPAMMPGRCDCD